MEMKQLSAFAAVYEEGSMSRAAERLTTTQPGVSLLVKRLETDLGAVLFERHSAGVTPTLKADVLYPHAQRLLAQAVLARDSLGSSSQALQGLLRVGVAPTVARGVVSRQLPAFLDAHPEVDLRLTEGMSIDLVDWTIGGEFDFAVVTNPPDDRRVVARRIALEPMVLIAGPQSGRTPYSDVDLNNSGPLRLVLPFGRHRPIGALNRFLSSGMITVRQTAQTNSLAATLALVSETDWVTILSVSAVSDQLDKFSVQRIVRPAHDTEFFLIRPARGHLSAAAEEFSRLIEAGFGHSLGEWKNRRAR